MTAALALAMGPASGTDDLEKQALPTRACADDGSFDTATALVALKEMTCEHQLDDPNFPQALIDRALILLATDKDKLSVSEVRQLLGDIEAQKDLTLNDSAYAEVRAVVSNTDDPSIECNTFRVWFIGLIFSVLGCAINTLFYYRMPGISITYYVAQFAAYPCGRCLSLWLPRREFSVFNWRFSFNPGPFNQKEHTLISVMTAVSFGGAYVTDIFVVQRLPIYYNQEAEGGRAGYQVLLALSTQLLGYGCAGITRKFLVYPAQMIWPSNLAVIALNRAMHHDEGKTAETVRGPFGTNWTLTRSRFLFITMAIMFFYFWLPDYLFEALGNCNWITWFAPSSVLLAIITGNTSGLGFNPVPTLDWNNVTSLIDPIVTPFFSIVNSAFGMFVVGIAFVPAVYFLNVWSTGYLPINSNSVYDNTGNLYNVSRVMDVHGALNATAYRAYSPAYFAASNALTYGAFFAIYTATISHVILYHRKEIMHIIRNFRKNIADSEQDIHNRLMKAYKEEWWYAVIDLVAIILGILCAEIYETNTPIWAIFFSAALCLALQIPIGIIIAVTNVEVTNNVLAEFIGGYALPGKPLPLMIFKAYGYISTSQAISFSSDLKLGFYMKIPPRVMFATQTVATVVGALTAVLVTDWVIVSIPGLCTKGQGLIGPKRLYGQGGIYHALTWGFLVGLLLPFPIYMYTSRYPRSWLRHAHIPVILNGAILWAPYGFSYIWPAVVVGFLFNHYIKRRYEDWWLRYAFVLTTSWNIAIAVAGIVIFFTLGYSGIELNWWGNTISDAGCDQAGCPYLSIPTGGLSTTFSFKSLVDDIISKTKP